MRQSSPAYKQLIVLQIVGNPSIIRMLHVTHQWIHTVQRSDLLNAGQHSLEDKEQKPLSYPGQMSHSLYWLAGPARHREDH